MGGSVKEFFDAAEGETPLDADETMGLIPSVVATRRDLNLLEEANIGQAREWALNRKHPGLLTDGFVRELHRRMFKDVWRWAGSYRTSGKNLGVPSEQIAPKVRDLCADAAHWVEKGAYPWDEAAARLHHRLVSIHPFANGNGRHARLFVDVFLKAYGQEVGSWGAIRAEVEDQTTQALRKHYIDALQAADRGDCLPLIAFLRS
jgi:Fic-DOC domain mobile mystery protein B